MTILAAGPNFIMCGSAGHIRRQHGRRLPGALVPWVGRPFTDCPTDVLRAYQRWLTKPPDGWAGCLFELQHIDDVVDARATEEEQERWDVYR
jgi:hypothetical protein